MRVPGSAGDGRTGPGRAGRVERLYGLWWRRAAHRGPGGSQGRGTACEMPAVRDTRACGTRGMRGNAFWRGRSGARPPGPRHPGPPAGPVVRLAHDGDSEPAEPAEPAAEPGEPARAGAPARDARPAARPPGRG